jgi:hypothetical protein
VGNIAYANDSITLDTTPPHSLSIIITDVVSNASAGSTVVTLTLNAIDATSGVHQMSFRTDGSAWCAWEEYNDMAYYTLPTTGDKHTIYFMGKDRAGNTADAVSAICYMNTTSPEPGEHRPDKSKSSINVSMSFILWLIIFTIILILLLVVLRTSRSKRSKRELRAGEVGTKPIEVPALAKLQPETTPKPTLAQPPGTTADGAQPAQGTTTPIPKLASPTVVGKTPAPQQIPQPTLAPKLPPPTQKQTTESKTKETTPVSTIASPPPPTGPSTLPE